MTFPTNPYMDPTPISPPAVAGGVAATAADCVAPGAFTVTVPAAALYDTGANPLIIGPAVSGLLAFVLNIQATPIRVVGQTSDVGSVVVGPNTQALMTYVPGAGMVLISGATPVLAGPGTARAVVTAALPAYTRAGSVITANAVGAPGGVFDGVTPVAGDIVFLPEGIAVAATDAGPYVVTQMGTAGLKLILTRPTWWTNGASIVEGTWITIQEGTIFKNTQWTTWVTTSGKFVGTDAPLFFPDRVILTAAALVGGTVTLTSVPIRSATQSLVTVGRVVAAGAGIANTVGYWPTVGGANGITPGALGTASIVIEAAVAAGTKNATDTSTITVKIEN